MQDSIQWVLRICAIEPSIAIAVANDQIRRLELGHLILDRSQCEKAKPRQLARVELPPGSSKEQPQHLCAHDRKQSMQQCLFDSASVISNALSSQVTGNEFAAEPPQSTLTDLLECFKHSRFWPRGTLPNSIKVQIGRAHV